MERETIAMVAKMAGALVAIGFAGLVVSLVAMRVSDARKAQAAASWRPQPIPAITARR